MATLVLKILDFIRLHDDAFETFTDSNSSHELMSYKPRSFRDEYNQFFERTDTLYRYSLPVLPDFWRKHVLDAQLPIRPLFSQNPATTINNVVSATIDKYSPLYQGVNFYNYFAVDGLEADLLRLLENWQRYLVPDEGKVYPLKQPIEVIYIKGDLAKPTVLDKAVEPLIPIFPGPPWSSDPLFTFSPMTVGVQHWAVLKKSVTTQGFWHDLGLDTLPPLTPNEATASVIISDIEPAWQLPSPTLATLPPEITLVKFGTNLPANPANGSFRQHGRRVLELINGSTPPLRGIAPTAAIALYAATFVPAVGFHENRTDDALLAAIWQNRLTPGNMILLEVSLPTPPIYDPAFGVGAGFNYPIETEQAIFDLISLATRTAINLLIVEPAANGIGFDLDTYKPKPYKTASGTVQIASDASFSTASTGDAAVWAFYTACAKRNRTLRFDKENDSGAIMVGAVKRDGSGWKRTHNFGSRIDVNAPGDGVPVSDGTFGETSAASALIAGSVGLLQQLRRSTPGQPDWHSADIRAKFRTTLGPTHTQLPDMTVMAS